MSVTPRISARTARFAGVAAAATALTLGVAGSASACNISEFSAEAICDGDQGVITVKDVDSSGTLATVTLFTGEGSAEKLVGTKTVAGSREGTTITFAENWAPNTHYRIHVKTKQYNVDDDIKGGVTTPSTACATEKPTTPPATPEPSSPAPSDATPSASTPAETATPSPSVAESTSPAAPAPANSASPAGGSDLAETGANSNTGLFAGIAAALVVAGGGVVFALRKRGAAQR
ncbi:LAETG motif-containing sortase-dependent surface protein [Streptomyces sp. NPDC006552]|uniref:LAETG motif-containing sortase-dependent surface protein n=1 Tax=Streptomyces sp. NPDC006552 TaxID=3157179 RepID=UPI0033B40C78